MRYAESRPRPPSIAINAVRPKNLATPGQYHLEKTPRPNRPLDQKVPQGPLRQFLGPPPNGLQCHSTLTRPPLERHPMALKHRARTVVIGIVVLLAVLVALCAWYVSDYHHAVDVDSALASSDAVQVQPVQQGWLFDGPGEQDALVFYPGAKVEASAYAPLMNDLAQRGIDCFLVEMPFNLAFLDMNAASSILDNPVYGGYGRWYLAGHSLGGAMAANYAADHPEQLSGLILLAAYPTKSLQTAGFPVLSIYGSNDGVVNRSRIEAGRSLMPPVYQELVIEGGNHAQFGSYGAQDGDGEASIFPEEQRAQTADAITDLVAQASVAPSSGSIALYGEEHAVPHTPQPRARTLGRSLRQRYAAPLCGAALLHRRVPEPLDGKRRRLPARAALRRLGGHRHPHASNVGVLPRHQGALSPNHLSRHRRGAPAIDDRHPLSGLSCIPGPAGLPRIRALPAMHRAGRSLLRQRQRRLPRERPRRQLHPGLRRARTEPTPWASTVRPTRAPRP